MFIVCVLQQIEVTAGNLNSNSGARIGNKKKFLLQRSFSGEIAAQSGSKWAAALLRRTRRMARRLFQFAADDEGPAVDWKGLAYIRVGCVLALTILDIVTALTVQIFWLDRFS